MSEDKLQSECFFWLWTAHPETRRCFFHVPNEMEKLQGESKQSHIRRIMNARSKGVVKGVWDNVFLWEGSVNVIELKVGKNGLSPEQMKFGDVWEKHGARKFEVRSLEEFQEVIEGVLNSKPKSRI